MPRRNGFTLIELLIVVAIIGTIAAIGLPGLLRARVAANEASAIATVRAISSSEGNYAATCGSGGYATNLTDLETPPPGTTNGFISPDMDHNGVGKSGYVFSVSKNAGPDTVDVVTPSCNAAATPRASSFYADAAPAIVSVTGRRFFATDTPGTIYEDLAAIANPIPAGSTVIH